MEVPFTNLKEQYQKIKIEIDNVVKNVFSDSIFILGSVLDDFESDLKDYCESKFAIGVASGSDALLLSMLALGISTRDEVITSPFTFIAPASSISLCGAKPVFVDIDPRTYNIDPLKIEAAISESTKAIVPVHLYGQCADMKSILDIANKYNLKVIEDAAQSIGARYDGKPAGSFGDCGAISFYPTKNLGGYGDGGAIVTDDSKITKAIKILRHSGAKTKYFHESIGYNSRLDALQAAILKVKLRYLNSWNNQRRKIAYKYNEFLNDTDLVLPFELPAADHVYHQYTIQVPEYRDDLKTFLKRKGIDTIVYYPMSLHLQSVYSELGYAVGELPVSEKLCNHVISLPCYPELREEQQYHVISVLREFYGYAPI